MAKAAYLLAKLGRGSVLGSYGVKLATNCRGDSS
jgi:hypothetical protein